MGKWVIGIGTGVVIAVVAGFILLQMEYGWFARAVDSSTGTPVTAPVETPQEPSASESSEPAGDASTDTPAADGSDSAEADSAPPPALDNRAITEARIEVKGTKISPTVYRAGTPGYIAHVFTEAGEIEHDAGCYVHWELYNNGVLLTTGDTSCNVAGGWSTAWWPNGTRLENGEVRVVGSITTEWGEATTVETVFTVQRD